MDMAYANPDSAAIDAPGKADDQKKPRKLPQESLNEFWDGLISKTPGKVFQIFPRSLYANLLPPIGSDGAASRERASASYQAAADECREKVARIVRECRRTNEKFTDPDFDIEDDRQRNCLKGLSIETATPSTNGPSVGGASLRNALSTVLESRILGDKASISIDVAALQNALEDSDSDDDEMYPATVHRVDYIFDEPSFILDGYSSSDVQQGANGDCWWVAAVSTLCSKSELMPKVCVARDAECGVYGFVFYRDGDWISTVVDDNLYMRWPDFDAWGDSYDATGEKERKYKQQKQTGSEALYFAKCADPNETWLPLLEKAYAKVHGDYDSIQGGDSGEAVEDMTGGVSVTLLTNKILSKDKLWQELLNVNKDFIFAASSPYWGGWGGSARGGLANTHAYSILKAVEEVGEDDKKVRLVLVRNPWGKRAWNGVGEWTGPWSDGSKEWTPYWMSKLHHRFGDDGEFWMSYTDLCRKFDTLHRTRLFDESWLITQQWTSVHVSWVSGYLTTKFVIKVAKPGTVIIVLSQLDSRYFEGLQGQYSFTLHFLLQAQDAKPGEHLVRVTGGSSWFNKRSISAEINLEPGTYEVLPKISATRDSSKPFAEDVVKKAAEENPQKLRQIGLNYDLAHIKGGFQEEEDEKKTKADAKAKKLKEEKEKKEKAEKKKAEKEKADKEEAEKARRQKANKEKIEQQKAEREKAEKDKAGEGEGNTKAEAKEEKKLDEKTELTETEPEKNEPISPNTEEEKKPDTDEKPKPGTEEEKKPDQKPEESAPATAKPSVEESPNPWNAVAVIGLRAYSKDQDLVVTLVKPKDPEEASMLDVDGVSGAGATA